MRAVVSCLIALVACSATSHLFAEKETAEPTAQKNDAGKSVELNFKQDVLTVLQQRCVKCHGTKLRGGGLRFTLARDLTVLNDSGNAVVTPGKPTKSQLMHRITATDDARMPPEGEPLSKSQIDSISKWIQQGAVWPKDVVLTGTHWAYDAPKRPTLPAQVSNSWIKNPIDAFVLAKLGEKKLSPARRATKERLIRRVYLDVLGIAPSPQEVDAFLADASDGAYERVVERLLASPRYGERWTRQWLDLARYADSNGFQADQFRSMWAYRDWVIQAFNSDMPFDEFTIAQIAGDLLPDAQVQDRIATGFHRCPTCNVEAGVDPEENRVNQVVDRINTTGTVWLGTTLECAQCHNHKYDPFSQQDYYQIFAFFNQTPLEVKLSSGVTFDFYGPKMSLPLDEAQAGKLAELEVQLKQLAKQTTTRQAELAKTALAWEQALKQKNDASAKWHVLDVAEFKSIGGASHTKMADKSILLTGAIPDKDTYQVTVRTELQGITGFRLEALLDDTLPGKGPGRQTQGDRGNAVLSEFSVTACECEDDTNLDGIKKLQLHSASADVVAKTWEPDKAIDGDNKTGWSIHIDYHKPHHWSALTSEPIGFASGTRLVFTIDQRLGLQRTYGRFRLLAMTGTPESQPVPADVLAITKLPLKKRSRKQKAVLRKYQTESDPMLGLLNRQTDSLTKQRNLITPPTTLVMVEGKENRTTNVMLRGEFLNKGIEVKPNTPSVLHSLDGSFSRDRLGFAQWLVDRKNPLVARVAVNRWWAEIFGRGIVASLEDFGTQGDRPTHPKLLDWLAVEFMDSGWSMKHMHRLMVTSATYQQSATRLAQDTASDAARQSVDPKNLYLSRASRFRLPAETIRDNALSASGLLAGKMDGPPVYPPQPPNIWRHVGRNAPKYITSQGLDRYRRGIYTVWRRSAPYPSFVTFDAPDRGSCVVNRSRTNTPLQALNLLNDQTYVEFGFALAERVLDEVPSTDIRKRMEYAFRLCLVRKPKPAELDFLVNVFRSDLDKMKSNPQQVKDLLSNWKPINPHDPAELAAWYRISEILLNLDEMITRG
jgi:hypothetical protein